MLCNKCGALNEDAATVCSECGADLTTTEDVEVTAAPAEEIVVSEDAVTEEVPAVEETPVAEEIPVSEETPAAEEVVVSENVVIEEVAPRMNIFKKWWFWLIAAGVTVTLIVSIITIIVCVNDDSSSSSCSYSVPVVNPYVRMVKEATNSNYGITYGDAFNSFFSSPKWSHFTSTDGQQVVEFEGGFTYSGSPAKAKFQFVVNVAEGTLQVYHLSIDGKAQNKLMLATFVKKVFESY